MGENGLTQLLQAATDPGPGRKSWGLRGSGMTKRMVAMRNIWLRIEVTLNFTISDRYGTPAWAMA